MDAERVRSTVFDLAREDRDALLSWSTQNAPLMAAEMGVDQVKFAVMHENMLHSTSLSDRSDHYSYASRADEVACCDDVRDHRR
jgi:hypothetical protein